MKPSDRYLKIVEWSAEDRVYVGRCPSLFLGGVQGRDEVSVYRDLCRAVEEHLRIRKAAGDPLPLPTSGRKYSGKLMVRLKPELHETLSVEAELRNLSLNQLIASLLAARTSTPTA